MDNKNIKTAGFPMLFGIAAAWFGTHVGGGFASGTQTVAYFVQYGKSAWWIPVVVMLLNAVIYRECMVSAYRHKCHTYKTWTMDFYRPLGKPLSVAFEICYFFVLLAAIGASVAGAASLMENFNVNYTLGIVITGAFLFILSVFGAKFFRDASTYLTIAIVLCLAVIYFVGFTNKDVNVVEAAVQMPQEIPLGSALWKGLCYCGFQSWTVATMASCCKGIKSDKDASKSMIMGFVLNAVMLCISVVMLMGWFPLVGESTLPIYDICAASGSKLAVGIYSAILLLAFISTGVSCVFAFVTRFENTLKVPSNIKYRRFIIAAAIIVCSCLVSTLGLKTIINKGYSYLGAVGIFFIIIPVLTLGIYRNRKESKANPDPMIEEAAE